VYYLIGNINLWAKGIIFAIIISGIIEIIIPEGNSKKYIKTVIGIYIVFVVIHPIVSKFTGNRINIDSLIDKTTKETSIYNNEKITLETNKYIEDTYKEKIREEISKNAKEKGYVINSLAFDIEKDNNENYGKILRINMNISKINENEEETTPSINSVNRIKEIEINTSNSNESKHNLNKKNKSELTEDEINSFKENISNVYEIEKSKIHINE